MEQSIHILDSHTINQIAAGEIIERPSCVVRELMDNSIDAGASHIEILLKQGGLEKICISDNGKGMNKIDLQRCYLLHATSKTKNAEDLQRVMSMGFRGEALASISAISKTTITSSYENQAHSIVVEGTTASPVKIATHNNGTRIEVEKLFYNIPVRKKFLSTISAERTRIKNTVLEKAAAFPSISISLKEDRTILHLPKETVLQRAIRVSNQQDSRMFLFKEASQNIDSTNLFHNNEGNTRKLRIRAALGIPDIAVKTRKNIYIYINNRCVQSFQITQAIEHAYKDSLHGQLFPQAIIFIDISPLEIDVNVHPTKQEVRIKNITQVRSLIIQCISSALSQYAGDTPYVTEKHAASTQNPRPLFSKANYDILRKENNAQTTPYSFTQSHYKDDHNNNVSKPYKHTTPPTDTTTPPMGTATPKADAHYTPEPKTFCEKPLYYGFDNHVFVGCVFATYAVFEYKEELLFLDFHAIHERKLFDFLLQSPKPHKLLIPVPLELANIASEDINILIEECKKIGILIEKDENNVTLTAIPHVLHNSINTIISIIEQAHSTQSIDTKLFARTACKNAVKAGDFIDKKNAQELLNYARELEHPRCPHGRPLWLTIKKPVLDKMIGRIS